MPAKTPTAQNDHGVDDLAPGAPDSAATHPTDILRTYAAGLLLAILLTAASFAIATTNFIWPPAIPMALAALAVAQIGVHLVFFLHLTSSPDNLNNTLALAFGVLIVALIVGGSLWIMSHLNTTMMPH